MCAASRAQVHRPWAQRGRVSEAHVAHRGTPRPSVGPRWMRVRVGEGRRAEQASAAGHHIQLQGHGAAVPHHFRPGDVSCKVNLPPCIASRVVSDLQRSDPAASNVNCTPPAVGNEN